MDSRSCSYFATIRKDIDTGTEVTFALQIPSKPGIQEAWSENASKPPIADRLKKLKAARNARSARSKSGVTDGDLVDMSILVQGETIAARTRRYR